MSIDTDWIGICCRCGRGPYLGDNYHKIPYKRFEGLPPDEILLCESCFQDLLEAQEKKAEAEAAAREKKSRRFRFFGQKGGKQK